MSIEFVDQCKVELVQSRATDDDVAMAAWVSNFDKTDLPVTVPDEYELSQYNEYIKLGHGKNVDTWYPDVKPYRERVEFLIKYLYKNRHMSPFEHGSMTFYIECPIFVAREFMRHRTWSYNETSGRYKELKPVFYMPPVDRPLQQVGKIGNYSFEAGTEEQIGEVLAQTSMSYIRSWDAYQNMLGKGVAKEVARNVLPVGIMTSFYATANPRNIMQFLQLRNDGPALKEIRDVAVDIEKHFANAMPMTYAAYKEFDWRDERKELVELRKRVQQLEAEQTYPELFGGLLEPLPELDTALLAG